MDRSSSVMERYLQHGNKLAFVAEATDLIPFDENLLIHATYRKRKRIVTVGLVVLFISAISAAGILAVNFAQHITRNSTCLFVLEFTTENSIIPFSRPKAVAVGDFDNDGRLDIVSINSDSNKIGIFLGNGDGTFSSQLTYSTGEHSCPHSAAIRDFNNNHHLDIAVTNFGTNTIVIFYGKGDGTFTLNITISTGSSRPLSIAVDDLNGDTRWDIVIANYGTNDISIILGYEYGSFANLINFSTGFDSVPSAIAIADFNKDNILDVVVANYGTNHLGIFLGDGHGKFSEQKLLATGVNSHPTSVSFGDLDNDSVLDIVVANSGKSNIGIFLGYGNGSFQMQKTYSTGNGSFPISIAIGYFNYDNKLDVIVASTGTNTIDLFHGYGNGTFSTSISYSLLPSSNPSAIMTGDFNNDHLLDVVINHYDTNDISIFLTYANDTFSNQFTYFTGDRTSPRALALNDLNHDGKLDMIVIYQEASGVAVFVGNGDGTFSSPTIYVNENILNPRSMLLNDFNNDKQIDIVFANQFGSTIGILLGDGNASFRDAGIYSCGFRCTPFSITSGDFNNDENMDIAIVDHMNSLIVILLGYGNGTLQSDRNISFLSNYSPYAITVGDFNSDHELDLAVANEFTWADNNVGVFLGYGNSTFSNQIVNRVEFGSYPRSVAVGDLNSDSHLDIVVGNLQKHNVAVFLGYGNGTFASPVIYSTAIGNQASFPNSVIIDDFNNDGRPDIGVTNVVACNVGILFGVGDGTFSSQIFYSTGEESQPQTVATGDLNKDGRLDFAVVNINIHTISVFIGLRATKLVRKATYPTGYSTNPRSLMVHDFNKDGRLDIIVANSGQDNIGVLLSNKDGSYQIENTYYTGSVSFPVSVVAGDFNNDDKVDIAVANLNTNSIGLLVGNGDGTFVNQTIHPTAAGSNPRSLAVGDFNNDSRLDLVVAHNMGSSVNILVWTNGIVFESETVYKTGATSKPYSLTHADFDKDGIIDIAVANVGTDTIGIFYGLGNGSFSDQTILKTWNHSGPISLTVSDFNNDGRLDIIFITNTDWNTAIFYATGHRDFSELVVLDIFTIWPEGLTVGDFNNDTRMDFAIVGYDMDFVLVSLQTIDGNFKMPNLYRTGDSSHPRFILTADFNNDSRLDLAVANHEADNVGIYLGYGNGRFQPQLTRTTGKLSKPRCIDVGDFNSDGVLDMAVAYQGSDSVGIVLGYGNGSFMDPKIYFIGLNSAPNSVKIADFNNDGKLDVAVVNGGSDSVAFLFGYANEILVSGIVYSFSPYSNPWSIVAADFNNDGQLDIAVTNSDRDNIKILISHYREQFVSLPSYSTGLQSQPIGVAVGNLNSDHYLDIVVANNASNNIIIFFGSNNGIFESETIYSTGNNSFPSCVVVGDFNHDKQLDIAVANYGTDSIIVFLGYGNGTFGNQMIYLTDELSQPTAMAVGDFDGDKWLDIVVTNYGSNNIVLFFGDGNGNFANIMTFSSGLQSNPSSIAVGDMNNNDIDDVIVLNSGYSNIAILSKVC